MKKRGSLVIISVIVLILLASFAVGECIAPPSNLASNNFVIDKNTELCTADYNINEGIIIGNDDVLLNCNNAKIIGEFSGIGIKIEEKNNITIINCDIKDFSTGIYVEDSTKISIANNILNNNRIGIILENSPDTAMNNNIDTSYLKATEIIEANDEKNKESSNEPDSQNAGTNLTETNDEKETENENIEETTEQSKEKINEENLKEINKETTETSYLKETVVNNPPDTFLPVRTSDKTKALQSVEISKTRTLAIDKTGKEKTTYETTIKALKDIKGLVLYEYFPKSVAENIREINFESEGGFGDADFEDKHSQFILIEEDPLVKKELGDLKKDEVVTITYNLDRAISGDTNPSSVVTIENSSRLITTLANISYILALYLVLVLVKRYKADKMLKEFKKTTKKLLGVPFPIAYIMLSIIPSVNYRFLASETIAILFYIVVILILLGTIIYLVKKKV
ncbi:hypothetical protein HY636_04740 [Candidatus Woesearchaeota archaeon]|nr:hypothetical protein [Candidatus Woesearchaeota archaeon]